MSFPERVSIAEVCPRDGFQSLPEELPTDDKVEIINELLTCGFEQIEVTSFVHPKAVPQLKDANEVLKKINRPEGVTLRALVPNLRGLDRAIEAGIHKVKLMLSATDSHSLNNANATTKEAMQKFEPLVKKAAQTDMKVSGSISVAFGCPYEGDIPIDRHIEICQRYDFLGITDISLADTTGMGNPINIKQVVRTLQESFPHFNFSMHLHNTRGMAFANALAAMEEGIIDFDSAVAGLGGCPYAPNASGNIASEDIIHGFEEMGIKTGIDLDKLITIGKKLQKRFPSYSDSFILKAGKRSDLHLAPGRQIKLSE